MKITITKKIGDTTLQFQVEAPKDKDALFTAGTISSIKTQCICGSTDVQLEGNKAEGFTFVKVACKKCYKVSQMGEYKDGGFFWKDFETPKKRDGMDSARDTVNQIKSSREIDDAVDYIPF